MKKIIAFILFCMLIAAMIAGCTPEGMIRRAVNKKPSLLKIDSTVKTSIIVHNHPPADTSFNKQWFLDMIAGMKQGDTSIIHNHYVTQKYFLNPDGSIGERDVIPDDTSKNTTINTRGFLEVEEKKSHPCKDTFKGIYDIVIVLCVTYVVGKIIDLIIKLKG